MRHASGARPPTWERRRLSVCDVGGAGPLTWTALACHMNGHRAAHMTCAVVIHVRCLTVIFLLYILGLSQKNPFVHGQNDDMSEEGYYYPFFCLVFMNKFKYHHKPAFYKYEDKGWTEECRTVRAEIITAFTGYIHHRITSQKAYIVKKQNTKVITSGWPYCCITHQSVQSYMYMYTKYIIEKLPHYAQKVHHYMQHQTMYNLTHNQCLSYMYLSANATS